MFLNKQPLRLMTGFTMVELIIIIILIGIVSVVVVPKWPVTGLGLEYESRRVLHDIRYAQALSMASGQRYRWVRLSSNSYSINNEAGTALVLPTGGTSVTLTSGITFGTLTNLPNNLIAFDSLGAPYTTSTVPGTALASTATIPLTRSGITRTISIRAETGYGVLS